MGGQEVPVDRRQHAGDAVTAAREEHRLDRRVGDQLVEGLEAAPVAAGEEAGLLAEVHGRHRVEAHAAQRGEAALEPLRIDRPGQRRHPDPIAGDGRRRQDGAGRLHRLRSQNRGRRAPYKPSSVELRSFLWDRRCRRPLATYPGVGPARRRERDGRPAGPLPYLVLLRMGFAVPRTVAGRAVRSYRTLSPLPRLRGAVCSLLHFPSRRRASPLASMLPVGARTFLPPRPANRTGGRPHGSLRPRRS